MPFCFLSQHIFNLNNGAVEGISYIQQGIKKTIDCDAVISINYRYTEDTVFKLDYQINMEEKDMTDISNNAFLFSVATYF